MSEKQHLETLLVHQNFRGDETNSVARGIYPSSAYYFNDADHGAALFDLQVAGNIYTRLTNPTNDDLGKLVSDMEGGVGGLAVATGAAALTAVALTLCETGDHIIASKQLYGGSLTLLKSQLSRLGITTTFVDQDCDYDTLKAFIRPQTRFIFAEVIGNPRADVLDIDKFSRLAKDHRLPLVIDSTFTPPSIFRPIDYGADIIIHSATKYLGGHGNAMAGIIVDAGTFDWSDEKYPSFHSPDPSYHGIVYNEMFGNQAFIYKVRTQFLRDYGVTLSPFSAYLIFNGIQTLHLRMERVSKTAMEITRWLAEHPKVEWVSYPLYHTHKDYELAKKYFPNGAGGVLSFGIKGDREGCKRFVNSLELGVHAVNVGDTRTIITHPASTTHRQSTDNELAEAGITPTMIRLSVGLEHPDDIKSDLDQALGRV